MSQPSLRERKKQKTKREIAAAALELCCSQGFDATTVEEIAARAEVSTSTFFRYFGSKEAALLGYQARGLTDFFWPALQKANSFDEILKVVQELVLVDARVLDAEPRGKERVRLILNTPALSSHQLQAEGMVEDAIGQRLSQLAWGDDIFVAHLMAGAIMGAVRAARRVWLDDRTDRTAESYVQEAYEALRAHAPR